MTEVEEMDNGRISLLAASIVFVLFGIMTTLLLAARGIRIQLYKGAAILYTDR